MQRSLAALRFSQINIKGATTTVAYMGFGHFQNRQIQRCHLQPHGNLAFENTALTRHRIIRVDALPFSRNHKNQTEPACVRCENESRQCRMRLIKRHPVQVYSGFGDQLAAPHLPEFSFVHIRRDPRGNRAA